MNLFKSIPSSHAHGLLCRLLNGKDPLAKLFDAKVALPMRNAMLQILCQQ
jgi:hypothetical protein